MRVFVASFLALGLAASPALASNAAPGGEDPAATSNSSSAAAQPANAPAKAATAAPSSMEVATELQQLRELVDAQAKQLAEQQEKMKLIEEQLQAASPARGNLEAVPAGPESASGAASAAVASNAAVGSRGDDKAGSPTSISFKGVTLTPGGYMAAETVWRQKALSADVNTPLNANPFNGSSAAHVTEWNASARQSRISMLVEGKLDNVKIGGYYETDFLSAGVTSNNNESNSYTLRQRQFWAQAAFTNGWTLTGGQQWSLLTETAKGMDNRSENQPLVIDAQYVAGFSWARQFGFRVTKALNDKIWLGMSVEEAQSTLTVHGNPTVNSGGTVVCTSANCATTATLLPTVQNNFLVGQFGSGGGLYNATANYAFNRAPDLIFKAVFEPGFGHYEVFGVVSQFRDRVFPCVPITGTTPPPGCSSITSAQFAFNDSQVGGGGGANARWALFNKQVGLGVHFLGGTGIGRYGSTGLPDATVRPDGTLAVLANYQALGTLQFHVGKKLDIYTNYGGEYSGKAEFIKSGLTPNEGYGAIGFNNGGCWTEQQPVTGPSTGSNTGVPTGVGGSTGFIPGPLAGCTGDTRNILEGTLGFWYRVYNSPKGRLQFGMQYSNLLRNTWKGSTNIVSGLGSSGQPHSDENMVFTSFRYYLP
ncbi:MAG TPA: hypothetical protein VJO53_10580 [Candidatus Acidoferrales bacterium]|nr:hypothetical protein [Candidatus Acidoferrales bacterium]